MCCGLSGRLTRGNLIRLSMPCWHYDVDRGKHGRGGGMEQRLSDDDGKNVMYSVLFRLIQSVN